MCGTNADLCEECRRLDFEGGILGTIKTQWEGKYARRLELPLLVRCLEYSFCFIPTGG